jgi:hypothetical protein
VYQTYLNVLLLQRIHGNNDSRCKYSKLGVKASVKSKDLGSQVKEGPRTKGSKAEERPRTSGRISGSRYLPAQYDNDSESLTYYTI